MQEKQKQDGFDVLNSALEAQLPTVEIGGQVYKVMHASVLIDDTIHTIAHACARATMPAAENDNDPYKPETDGDKEQKMNLGKAYGVRLAVMRDIRAFVYIVSRLHFFRAAKCLLNEDGTEFCSDHKTLKKVVDAFRGNAELYERVYALAGWDEFFGKKAKDLAEISATQGPRIESEGDSPNG